MADIIYPLYIVIDASLSMGKEIGGKKRIDLAKEIPLSLLKLYEEDPSLVSSVYVSVLTFNTEVKVISELGEIPKLRNLAKQEIVAESRTHFGKVFSKLYDQIKSDYDRLSGANKFMKPAVIIVTDGGPNDDKDERHAAFRKLLPVDKLTNKLDKKANKLWPQIFMFGIDAANENVLKAYSYKNTHYYKATDALDVDEQIQEIARKVKDAVTTTFSNPTIQTDALEPWKQFIEKGLDGSEDVETDPLAFDEFGNIY
jgi:uncharacterized protein YegL